MKKTERVDSFLWENIHTDFLPSELITDVEEAIRRANQYGDFTQLAIFMEEFPQEVTENTEACQLMADLLRGKVQDRRGKSDIEQMKKEIRDLHILELLYFLKGFGIPIKTESKNPDKKDACSLACEYVNRCGLDPITGPSIYKQVWLKHKNHGYFKEKESLFQHFFFKGQNEKNR